MSNNNPHEKAADLVKELRKIIKEMTTQFEEKEKLADTAQSRIEELMADIQLKTSQIDRLNRTIKEIREKAETATDLMVKNKALQAEIDAIKTQLEKMSATYRELAKEQEANVPVQELLALYVALLEEVFFGQPHAKALFLLHGARQEMTREAIIKTAGHEATAIRKALGDLSRAGLIDYDVETGIARLKKRLYSS